MALPQRLISVSVTLGQNTQTNQPLTFAETGTASIEIKNLRTSVRVNNSGNPASCSAEIKIWGLPPSIMNQLSTLGLQINLVSKNSVLVKAGNAGSSLSTVFQGTILDAYGDYEQQPNVPFVMIARLDGFNAAGLALPTSFPQPFDVATAMGSFARQMGIQFINNGVNLTMPPSYFTGSLSDQVTKLKNMARIGLGYPNFTALEIWPLNQARTTPSVPKITPQMPDGSISYPSFTQQGIIVKTIFNPLISLGGMVEVDSTILGAIAQVQQQRGLTFPTQWVVVKLDLALDSQLPGGQWMSVVYGYSTEVAKKIIPPT